MGYDCIIIYTVLDLQPTDAFAAQCLQHAPARVSDLRQGGENCHGR
jgi:hypothetical protein